MDVFLDVPADDLSLRCNRYLPDGLRILEAAAVGVTVPKLAADVTAARYDVLLDDHDVFDCPQGTRKPLLEKVAENTPVSDPSWKAHVLKGLTATVRERFSGESAPSENRDAEGPGGATPVILEIECDKAENGAATQVRVQFLSTMHGGKSLFPEDILTPLLGEPSGYATPMSVVRMSLYVERGGRYISPMSRAALENKT